MSETLGEVVGLLVVGVDLKHNNLIYCGRQDAVLALDGTESDFVLKLGLPEEGN
jgi:hypothetical protein